MVTAARTYPLTWPEGVRRSTAHERSPFTVSIDRALSDLRDALRLFGTDTGRAVCNVVISSNVALGDRKPADPGIAVYFEWDGAQRCVAVDRYSRPEDNLRAIYHLIEARWQEMRYGGLDIVRAAFHGFAALPTPERGDWRATLGVGPDADLAAAEAAWRDKARRAHPDAPAGSVADMAALNQAREAARRELGA